MELGPGIVPTFLYYFVGGTLIAALVASQGIVEVSNPVQIGLPFGLFAGLVGTYFNRSELWTVPYTNKKAFTEKLATVLTDLGYQETSTVEGYTVYARSQLNQITTGKVLVQLEECSAAIIARASTIRTLKQQLE
jgi:hypothetical protein